MSLVPNYRVDVQGRPCQAHLTFSREVHPFNRHLTNMAEKPIPPQKREDASQSYRASVSSTSERNAPTARTAG